MFSHIRHIIVLMLFSMNCGLANADLYDDYINSVSKKPFVAFLARSPSIPGSLTGHAFVAIGVEIDNDVKLYLRLFGYYPKDTGLPVEVKAIYASVSGAVDYKLDDISWTTEYRVAVDDDKQKAALGIIDIWKKQDPKYNLLANNGKNCSSFVGAVADAIGLNVPSGAGSSLPEKFIQMLRDAN